LWAGKEYRANGAPILPTYLEWILPCVPFQNVARKILNGCSRRPEAHRNVERFAGARLYITTTDDERIAGSGREIRRIRHTYRTIHIITAKIECPGSVIHRDNWNNKLRVGR
jgi:hypothetical protein